MSTKPNARDLGDVFTQGHFLAWIDDAEQWARSVLAIEADMRTHYAMVALDLCGRAKIQLGLNVQSQATWDEGGVRELALQIDKHRTLAAGLIRMKVSTIANESKREDKEIRTVQIAEYWKRLCIKHPKSLSDEIQQMIIEKFKIGQTTLDRHLVVARERGLIPKRHRRS